MTATETIEALGDRDNLSAADIRQLVEAKRATAPAEEIFQRDGWEVTLSHHAHTGGHWSAHATPEFLRGIATSMNEVSQRTLAGGDTEAECRRKVEEFFTSGTAATLRMREEKDWAAHAAWLDRRDRRPS